MKVALEFDDSSKTWCPHSVPTTRARVFQEVKAHAVLMCCILAAMWIVEVIDFLLPVVDADRFGIRPRTSAGLLGIPLSPFLHVGFDHLISNSLPFLIFGGLVMAGGRRVFIRVSLWVVSAGGLGVWLMGGEGTVHLGASLLIFGYLGFLLSRGFFERSVTWVLLSICLLVLYGGMMYGVFPGRPGISWLGHLCGFLAGISGAWLMFPRDGRAA